jgi:hypothetical protein
LHALPQSTALHALVALQVTSQAPSPHVTSWHAFVASQRTLHEVAALQSIDVHDCAPLHVTLQFQPAGQVTASQESDVVQSIVQLIEPLLHELHAAGHAPPSLSPTTQ